MEKSENKNKVKLKKFYEKMHEHIKKNIKEKNNNNKNYNRWQWIMMVGKGKKKSGNVASGKGDILIWEKLIIKINDTCTC